MEPLALLAVYAHPDDEAYGSAGTLAKYVSEGARATVISATRGEAGEISDPALASTENLAAVREAELRRACAILGLTDVRFLDVPDGGVANCNREAVVGNIVAVIRECRPQVVVTFGPEGIYGHSDHIAVHEMALAACDAAGSPVAYAEQLADGLAPHSPIKVYFRVIPKHQMPQLAPLFQQIRHSLGIAGDIEECFAPEDLVTTAIDVRAFSDVKLRAIAAHRTQIGDEPFAGLSQEEIDRELGHEHYRLRGARRLPGQPYESDLFAGIRQAPH